MMKVVVTTAAKRRAKLLSPTCQASFEYLLFPYMGFFSGLHVAVVKLSVLQFITNLLIAVHY